MGAFTRGPSRFASNARRRVRAIARVREDLRARHGALRRPPSCAASSPTSIPSSINTIDLQVMPIAKTRCSGSVRRPILILFAAVALVALIASANVGTLLVARAAERRLEFGIRMAIGAGPRHLSSQLLRRDGDPRDGRHGRRPSDCGRNSGWVVVATPGAIPRLEDAAVNWKVFAFSAATGAFITALVSMIPAVHLRRWTRLPRCARRAAVVHPALGFGSARRGGGGVDGAASCRRGFARAQLSSCDSGRSRFLAGQRRRTRDTRLVGVSQAGSAGPFAADALVRICNLPGVVAAGLVTAMPFLGSGSIEMEGAVAGSSVRDLGQAERRSAWLTIASDGYFEALGMKLRQGRTFSASDRMDSQTVAVVTHSFARHFLRGDPVGATVTVANALTPAPLTIVGVVNDLRHTALENPGREEIFIPFAQFRSDP